MIASSRCLRLVFLSLLCAAVPCIAQVQPDAELLPQIKPWGFDLTGMDRSVRPGDDFYRFANGTWLQRTKVPVDRPVSGSFPDLRFEANARVRDLLDDVSEEQTGTSYGKAALLYREFLDQKLIDQRGAAPLNASLHRVRVINTKVQMAAAMGRTFAGFGSSLFQIDLAYDRNNPKHYAIYLGQSGLGLPDRDYYLDPKFDATKRAYREYIAHILSLAGWSDPEGSAHAIVSLETRIAEAYWPHAEVRNPDSTYHLAKIEDMRKAAPNFDWTAFFRAASLGHPRRIVITTDSSVYRLARIFESVPLNTWKTWEAFHIVDDASPYLSDAFVQAHFDFHLHTLSGQPSLAPRWVRGVEFVNQAMGSAVGQLYADRYLKPESIRAVNEIVTNLRQALQERLKALPWLSPATQTEALRKLANLKVQVGVPNHWIDYGDLQLEPHDLFRDVEEERRFNWRRRVSQLKGLWNESDWRFWPQYPTAYTEDNNLIFTAAMLQPPFFDPHADSAINYGGIGAVIGHEMTHSFDDQGRKQDADNRQRNWWTEKDVTDFQRRADMLTEQFSSIEPLSGSHINGAVTLGENIADLGGVLIALRAYEKSCEGQIVPLLDGYTGEQRFFLGWAQAWREKWRDDALRKLLATDLHSPGVARVNGVVRDLDTWYVAFGVVSGDGLFLSPGQRISIW